MAAPTPHRAGHQNQRSGADARWGVAMFAAIAVVMLWGGVLHLIRSDRDNARQMAEQELSNFAQMFDLYISQTIESIDGTLKHLRTAIAIEPEHLDLELGMIGETHLGPHYVGFFRTDAKGIVEYFSTGRTDKPLDLSDRPHVAAQLTGTEDKLFIGQPLLGRASNRWSLHFTRPILDKAGKPEGVAILAISPEIFTLAFDSLNLGPRGSVALVGMDRALRARRAAGSSPDSGMGILLPADRPYFDPAQPAAGFYRPDKGIFDGIPRVIAYRRLAKYPLAVLVTQSEADIYQEAEARAGTLRLVGATGSIAIFAFAAAIFILLGRRVRAARKLDEAQDALRASERRFRDFAESSHDWFWETDENHRFSNFIITESRADIDWTRYLGQTRLELMALHNPSELVEAHRRVLDARLPFRDLEYGSRRADGTPIWFKVSGRPMFGEDGKFLGYRGSASDFTKAHVAEKEIITARDRAVSADRAKSEFLANMSHELRTPLNAIIGFSEVLLSAQAGRLSEDRAKAYLGDIKASGEHLLAIINDVLDVSAIEVGKLKLQESVALIDDLMASCIRLVQPKADLGRIEIGTDIAPELPPILIDIRRMKQAIINLLANSVKFTPEGGKVIAGAAPAAGGGLAIWVEDTGIGMNPHEMEIALTRFGQVETAFSRTQGGTGLGLPLVCGLIELHGGRLELESAPGKGTKAILFLPPERIVASPKNLPPAQSGR